MHDAAVAVVAEVPTSAPVSGRASKSVVLIALAVGIYAVAASARWSASTLFPGAWQTHPWLDQAVLKTLLGAGALLLLRGQGISLREAGFRPASAPVGWVKLIAGVCFLNFALSIVALRLPSSASILSGFTLSEALFWGAVYSTIVEEAFFRGWLQTALSRLFAEERPKPGWSMSVLISAALFAAMHGFLILRGIPAPAVMFLVGTNFFMGLIYARVRQRTGSVLPAIVAHVTCNAGALLFDAAIWFIITHPTI